MDPNMINMHNRISSIEKHISTDLPKYLDDYKKKTLPMFEATIGMMLCQNVLLQILTRDNVIKREEIGAILDSLISNLSEKLPNNPHAVQLLKNLRESINKAAPIQYPDWLQDLMGSDDPK